jgi:hypothetical protein
MHVGAGPCAGSAACSHRRASYPTRASDHSCWSKPCWLGDSFALQARRYRDAREIPNPERAPATAPRRICVVLHGSGRHESGPHRNSTMVDSQMYFRCSSRFASRSRAGSAHRLILVAQAIDVDGCPRHASRSQPQASSRSRTSPLANQSGEGNRQVHLFGLTILKVANYARIGGKAKVIPVYLTGLRLME